MKRRKGKRIQDYFKLAIFFSENINVSIKCLSVSLLHVNDTTLCKTDNSVMEMSLTTYVANK